MGGMGSGRHWYWGAEDTTDDYRSIDVRRWKRDGLLSPHQSFGWQWSRHGEVVASIRVRTEPGEDWKDESYAVCLDWTAFHLGGLRPWFICPARGCGRRVAVVGAWLSSTEGASLHAAIVTSWPTPVSGKPTTIAHYERRTESAKSSAGNRALRTAMAGSPKGCIGTPSSGRPRSMTPLCRFRLQE